MDQQKKEFMRFILPHMADIANSSSSSNSSEDEDIVATAVRVLPKTRSFFTSVETMDETEFRSHFKLGRGKFYYFICLSNVTKLLFVVV